MGRQKRAGNLSSEQGYCLVSQQIREKIEAGEIKVSEPKSKTDKNAFINQSLEDRIQPTSFEPIISDEIYILDIEEQSVFSPGPNRQVYRALLQLPKRQRQRVNISEGCELKVGHNYLLPLEEKVILKENERMKSSPKSSIGRLFPITRVIADYNSSFDEINGKKVANKEISLWLLIEPTRFNIIVNPGNTINQLRFFKGDNVSLSQKELLDKNLKYSLLSKREDDGTLTPIESSILDDGLNISLDLSGKNTNGIVSLRARKNPNPIDLSKKGYYCAEDYFEPIQANNGIVVFSSGEHYLIASKGVLRISSNLSAEIRRHYGSGIRGTWDEAGFADPGFTGDLVFEASFTETGGIKLRQDDDRVVSALEFFRTNQSPDKIYGEEIGSNYQGQLGPRVSKHFVPFDFAYAAKSYNKLNREVLVKESNILRELRGSKEGFEPVNEEISERLIWEIEKNGFFHSRYDCESDEDVLQIIPYVILFDNNERVFHYVRAKNIKDYGDIRLFGKHSIGLGGHIIKDDGPDFIENCVAREVMKEEISIDGSYKKPKLAGTLMAYDKPVDRVHFGLIYTIRVNGEIRANESSITSCGMKSPQELRNNLEPFETWSKILIPYLELL